MYAKFAARVPGIGQCRVIYRADVVNQFGAAQGNTAGGPLANGRSLALPGSKDCNQGSATPSDARGNRCIIVSPPQVVAKQPAGAAWGTDGIALRHVLHGASWGRHCWLCRTRRVPAHPPASLAGAGTYLPCWV